MTSTQINTAKNAKANAKAYVVFREWLGRISKHKMPPNDRTILESYVLGREDGSWSETQDVLMASRQQWWPFLRGRLDRVEMMYVKKRYLNQFVFCYGDAPSEPFVDALYRVEKRQFELRHVHYTSQLGCVGCRERADEILMLRMRLHEQNIPAFTEMCDTLFHSMSAYFHTQFLLDDEGAVKRSHLRLEMEKYLMTYVNSDIRIKRTSSPWVRFLRDVVRDKDTVRHTLFIRRRSVPLCAPKDLVTPPVTVVSEVPTPPDQGASFDAIEEPIDDMATEQVENVLETDLAPVCEMHS